MNGVMAEAYERQMDAARFRIKVLTRLAWHLLQKSGGRATFDTATLGGPHGQVNVRDAGEGKHEFIAGEVGT